MKLTKDEARILSALVEYGKYELVRDRPLSCQGLYIAIKVLEERLTKAGTDARRFGRTSQNNFTDCLVRFVKANNNTAE
jgi:hypothetical protein